MAREDKKTAVKAGNEVGRKVGVGTSRCVSRLHACIFVVTGWRRGPLSGTDKGVEQRCVSQSNILGKLTEHTCRFKRRLKPLAVR